MSASLTFLAVHAHPDDEASSSGGVFRLLKNQGVRTVLVTCTNGEFGDALGGIKPDQPGHDPDAVAVYRKGELEESCEILGIDRLVMLGYRDSGMIGWPQNDDPRSFWSTPLEEAAQKLAAILNEERPQVIMTYNEIGFYGHPDHIQAHRITLSALDLLDYQPTVYFNAIPSSVFARFREVIEESQTEEEKTESSQSEEAPFDLGTPDELIGAAIDVRSVVDAKFDALQAHSSQLDESFFLRMGRERFKEVMGTEWFVRAVSPFAHDEVVTDLFVDYR